MHVYPKEVFLFLWKYSFWIYFALADLNSFTIQSLNRILLWMEISKKTIGKTITSHDIFKSLIWFSLVLLRSLKYKIDFNNSNTFKS